MRIERQSQIWYIKNTEQEERFSVPSKHSLNLTVVKAQKLGSPKFNIKIHYKKTP